MSAWEVKVEENKYQESEEVEKTFEDNFTIQETFDTNKLPDSVDYIKKLGKFYCKYIVNCSLIYIFGIFLFCFL